MITACGRGVLTGTETINRLPLDSLRRNTFQRFRSMDIIDHPMPVNIIRSKKRAKTVQARIVGDTIEIVAPAQLSDTELQPLIAPLIARLERQRHKQHLNDEELARIATSLNQQYFNNGLTWNSLTWSTQQHKRFGSCTPGAQNHTDIASADNDAAFCPGIRDHARTRPST